MRAAVRHPDAETVEPMRSSRSSSTDAACVTPTAQASRRNAIPSVTRTPVRMSPIRNVGPASPAASTIDSPHPATTAMKATIAMPDTRRQAGPACAASSRPAMSSDAVRARRASDRPRAATIGAPMRLSRASAPANTPSSRAIPTAGPSSCATTEKFDTTSTTATISTPPTTSAAVRDGGAALRVRTPSGVTATRRRLAAALAAPITTTPMSTPSPSSGSIATAATPTAAPKNGRSPTSGGAPRRSRLPRRRRRRPRPSPRAR